MKVPIDKRLPKNSYLDLTAAGVFLGMDRATIHRWVVAGKMRAEVQKPWGGRNGWRYIIPAEEVERVRREKLRSARAKKR